MSRNRKNRSGIVYSTNKDFEYQHNDADNREPETIAPQEQNLIIYQDSKQRKGKIVTIVDNFTGTNEDINNLAKLLKSKCGVGGTVKDKQIIIQGRFDQKVLQLLKEMNFIKTKIK